VCLLKLQSARCFGAVSFFLLSFLTKQFYCDVGSYATLGTLMTYMLLNDLPVMVEIVCALWVALLVLLEWEQMKVRLFPESLF
jgi:hypothetical protein